MGEYSGCPQISICRTTRFRHCDGRRFGETARYGLDYLLSDNISIEMFMRETQTCGL